MVLTRDGQPAKCEQSCGRQERTGGGEELVDSACVLTVGVVGLLLGEGELHHQEAVVQQVEQEERGQNQLGQAELSPGQTGEEVGSVGDDGEEDEEGEEDDPDHAGGEAAVLHVEAGPGPGGVVLTDHHAGAGAGAGAGGGGEGAAVPAGRRPD